MLRHGDEGPALLSGVHGAGPLPPLQQAEAQLLLQDLDPAAQRRLGDEQVLSRQGEAPRPDHGQKGLELQLCHCNASR